jgi:hypothetical protein
MTMEESDVHVSENNPNAIGSGAVIGVAIAQCWVEVTPPSPCSGTEWIKCKSSCTQTVTNEVAWCEQATSACCRYTKGTLTCSNCSTPCTLHDEHIAYHHPPVAYGTCATVQGVRQCIPPNDPPGGD